MGQYAGPQFRRRADFFWSIVQDDDATSLTLPFFGEINGDIRYPRLQLFGGRIFAAEGPTDQAPLPDVVRIDIASGASTIDSGAALEFWLQFFLPCTDLSHLWPRP